MEGDINCLIKIKVYLRDKDTFNIYQKTRHTIPCLSQS